MKPESSKHVYELALQVANEFRSGRRGIRLFCTDSGSLAILLARFRNIDAYDWLRHTLVYLTKNVRRKIYNDLRRIANHFDGTLAPQPAAKLVEIETITNELLLMIDKYCPAWCVVGDWNIPVEDLSQKRVNLVLGDTSEEPELREFLNNLEAKQPVIDVSRPSDEEAILGLTPSQREREQRLGEIENLVLTPTYQNRSEGLTQFFPKCNLSGAPRAAKSLTCSWDEQNDSFNLTSNIVRKLEEKKVLVIGGLGCGCEFLAKKVLMEIALRNRKILELKEMSRQDATSELRFFLNKRHRIYGRAFLLRNFFDPVNVTWDQRKGHYGEPVAQESEQRFLDLFHHQRFENMLTTFMQSREADRYLVITTRFDSPEHLQYAINEQMGDSERKRNIERLVEWIEKEQLFFPLRIDEGTKRLLHGGIAAIEEWCAKNGKDYPQWVSDFSELRDTAVIGAENLRRFRPALWRRTLEYVLENSTDETQIQGAKRLAKRCFKSARETWKKLHRDDLETVASQKEALP